MHNTINSVGVLIINDKKVLLVCHGEGSGHLTGVYGFPAGRVEEGENEKQAAIRELFEETGLQTSEEYLHFYPSNQYTNVEIPRKDGTLMRFDYKVFVCRKYSGSITKNDEAEAVWIEIDKLSDYNLLPNVKETIEKEIRW